MLKLVYIQWLELLYMSNTIMHFSGELCETSLNSKLNESPKWTHKCFITIIALTWEIYKINDTNEQFTKQKQTHREGTYEYWDWEERMTGRDRLGVWDWHVYTVIFKTTNKDLLYSTGNSTQYSVITKWEKNLKKRIDINTRICTTESLCSAPKTNTTILQ